MGLEEILRNTEAEAEDRIASVLGKAKKESDAIKSNADSKAGAIIEEYRLRADREAKQLLAREKSRASIEAKAVFQGAIDAEVDRAIGELEGNMDGFVRGDGYARLLAKLAKEAHRLLGSGCAISVANGDEKKFKAPAGCTVRADGSIKGGIIAYSRDGKMYVDYTLERILERVKSRLVKRYTELIM